MGPKLLLRASHKPSTVHLRKLAKGFEIIFFEKLQYRLCYRHYYVHLHCLAIKHFDHRHIRTPQQERLTYFKKYL